MLPSPVAGSGSRCGKGGKKNQMFSLFLSVLLRYLPLLSPLGTDVVVCAP